MKSGKRVNKLKNDRRIKAVLTEIAEKSDEVATAPNFNAYLDRTIEEIILLGKKLEVLHNNNE